MTTQPTLKQIDALKIDAFRSAARELTNEFIAACDTSDLHPDNKGNIYHQLRHLFDESVLNEVLSRNNGNQSRSALMLGLNRATVRSRQNNLGLNRWGGEF